MGNSLRSTFGNMCGAEASKDGPSANVDQRPVLKPKESKKEKKKKSKKLKNGHLAQVPEENGPIKEAGPAVTEPTKPATEETQEFATPDEKEESALNTFLTIKEEADVDKINVNEDSDNTSDIIEEDHEDDEVEEVEEEQQKNVEKEPTKSIGSLQDSNASDEKPDRSDSTLDTEIDQQKIHNIHEVTPILPEVLGIGYADEIFNRCAETYQIFVEQNHLFRAAVLEFENSIDPHKKTPDFEKCWQCYQDLLMKENERSEVEGIKNRTTSISKVDICDISVNLQAIRGTGLLLLQTINEAKPEVDRCLAEAGTVDVIEYVKGKMVEGEQLGITSKFSAPGKYRRNMKQLKKAVKQLNGVEVETNNIIESVDAHLNDVSNSQDETLEIIDDDESMIIPATKRSDNPSHTDDIFSKLPPIETSSQVESVQIESKLNVDAKPQADGKDNETGKASTLLERSNNYETTKPKSDTIVNNPETTSITQTFIIKTIPEKDSPTISPVAKSESHPKSPITQVVVDDEEHNTLDFGRYVFVDPSTGDIQVMRNRSRSLDSLVSMTSSRSSISRFGSFEFVTDYEIVIAEKNQQIAS